VLGSGLEGLEQTLTDATVFEHQDLPNWPRSTVPGHAGRLIIGDLAGRRVAVLSGRVHLYEGYGPDEIVFGTRVMGRMGVREIVLTNAAGGIKPTCTPGTLMVIEDHINLLGSNPLTGANDERFGPRFPDLTEVYSPRLRTLLREAASARGVALERGVYAAVQGPSYETPAEIRALRALGADAVGMSTVPEAIAARHMGLEVLGLSCITNRAAGLSRQPLGHDDVLATARQVRTTVQTLLEAVVAKL
jgi:purine-nucleoside phosphorylase